MGRGRRPATEKGETEIKKKVMGGNGAEHKDSVIVLQIRVTEAADSISHTTQSRRQEAGRKNS